MSKHSGEAQSGTKMPSGQEAKHMERNEEQEVRAHAEDLKAQNVKSSRIETQRKQMPPAKR